MSETPAQRPPIHSLIGQLLSNRFLWLLVGLVAFIFDAGETPNSDVGRGFECVLALIILTGVAFAARSGRRRLVVALGLNSIAIAPGAVFLIYRTPLALLLCTAMCLLCLLFAIFTILEFVLTAGVVRAEHILAAI